MVNHKAIGNLKILEDLAKIASIIPAPIYWEDVDSVILGANEYVLEATGLKALNDYVGKTLYELYPKEMADHIKQHNEEVMRTGKVLSQEETITDTTGQIKHYAAVKAPLRDDTGTIIGVVGTSIEITAQKEIERVKREQEVERLRLEKEAEHLKMESEVHKKLTQEQEKFIKLANQVAHDIRSPLASLLMIVKSCTEIPETDRIALREAAISIGDIANHLLNQYQKKDTDSPSETEVRQPILISAVLLQLLTDKKYQYQNLPIKFDHNFIQSAYFAFINIEPSAFKRMISNLINNAVDSFDGNKGKVELKLEATNEWVNVSINDNGKGMAAELMNKILSNVAVTAGKKTGYGIGLTQVREALQRNQGEIKIDSEPGKGTIITLTFPRIKAPRWVAEEIKLGEADKVIILDDDSSIHGAWSAHFEPIIKQAPNIELKHFTKGKEALHFLENLSVEEKKKVFLLTDYELLKQELNGLHVVAKSQIQRSILVTSHYANPLVREQAAKTGTKILPKQLASEIPIQIDKTIQYTNNEDELKQVDLVIVDDDEKFIRNLVLFVFDDKTVDQYHDPHHFLNNVKKYPKDCKIYLDNNFAAGSLISGVEIAKQLHEQGYTNLYLLSGDNFKKEDVPSYLTVIRKDDIESIKGSL